MAEIGFCLPVSHEDGGRVAQKGVGGGGGEQRRTA